MEEIKDITRRLEAMSEFLDKVASSTAEPSPHAPEELAEKLGIDINNMLDPLTPLAASPEEANEEAEQQVLTRVDKLSQGIENKLNQIMGN